MSLRDLFIFLWLLRSQLFVALNTNNVLSSKGATCLSYLFKHIFFIVFNFIFLQNAHISGRSYGAFVIFAFISTNRPPLMGLHCYFLLFSVDFFQQSTLYYQNNKIFAKYKHLQNNNLQIIFKNCDLRHRQCFRFLILCCMFLKNGSGLQKSYYTSSR